MVACCSGQWKRCYAASHKCQRQLPATPTRITMTHSLSECIPQSQICHSLGGGVHAQISYTIAGLLISLGNTRRRCGWRLPCTVVEPTHVYTAQMKCSILIGASCSYTVTVLSCLKREMCAAAPPPARNPQTPLNALFMNTPLG